MSRSQVPQLPPAFVVALAMIGATACSEPDAPPSPTWAGDVRPVLAANCLRCHGYPAIFGAPDSFRLDVYEDTPLADGTVIKGAMTMAEYIAVRTSPDIDESMLMPPRFHLEDRQSAILTNWWESRPMNGPPMKGARPNNRPPTAELLQPLEDSIDDDGRVVVSYEIRDPDRDIVSGTLRARQNGTSIDLDGILRSGRGSVLWDVGTLAAGSYTLIADLDDGSTSVEVTLGVFEVSGANAAPTARILKPNRYDILHDADGLTDIVVEVADADGVGTYSVTIEAFSGDQIVTIVRDEAATVGSNTFQWDTSAVSPAVEQSNWQLQATVTEGANSRRSIRRPVIVSHSPVGEAGGFPTDESPLMPGSIAELLARKCGGCHPGANRIPSLTHDFFSYDDSDTALGVRSLRGMIYRRAILQRNMPPRTSQIFGDEGLTSDEQNRLRAWLLGGTPR